MVFSKEQKSAIHFKDGPALVLAGPGSGKTTVIVNRIISLIKEHSVSPSSILVITFTKAAAKSMRQRFLSLTGESYVSVTFGTFHAVSAITSVYKFYIYIAVLQCVFYYGTYYDGFMVDIR